MNTLEGKRILVTGGTGSLGQTLVKRLLAGELGKPAQITVFSGDEAKQHYNRAQIERLLPYYCSCFYRRIRVFGCSFTAFSTKGTRNYLKHFKNLLMH